VAKNYFNRINFRELKNSQATTLKIYKFSKRKEKNSRDFEN